MAVYVVTYDLNKETVRPKIVDAIREYGSWAKLSESSYAIRTNQSPEGVYGKLKPLLDDNDDILIISLSKPWTGYAHKDVIAWLQSELPG